MTTLVRRRPGMIGLFVFTSLLTPIAASAQQADLPPDLDAVVAGVMADYNVPGLAIAIVKDGKVMMARGYGVRTVGTTDSVDAHTIFGIASNSKAFTATSLAMLVEEGKIKWDDQVIDYLPWFRLSDPWVTSQLTIRDLLVHRSGLGLGAGDLLWWPGTDLDRRQIAERLRYIPLATSFRSAYAYDNVLYLVAGQVIEAVSGKSWEDFITDRILKPLGMDDTWSHYPPDGTPDVSSTHGNVEGKVQVIAPFTNRNTNPAGGIIASASDIAKWLMVQLDSGRVAPNKRLFSKNTTRALWSPVTPEGEVRASGELSPLSTRFNFYGLGFNVRGYRGHTLITHTGGLPGFISRLAMLPDQRVGVAVLTNMEASAINPITWHILDYYLGASHDWRAAYQAVSARQRKSLQTRNQRAAAQRDSTAGPALPLEGFAGHYQDRWYGGVDLSVVGDKLVIKFDHTPKLVGDLTHWQYNTFMIRWRDRSLHADSYMTFTLDAEGNVAEARIIPASSEVDFSFDFQDLKLIPDDQ